MVSKQTLYPFLDTTQVGIGSAALTYSHVITTKLKPNESTMSLQSTKLDFTERLAGDF